MLNKTTISSRKETVFYTMENEMTLCYSKRKTTQNHSCTIMGCYKITMVARNDWIGEFPLVRNFEVLVGSNRVSTKHEIIAQNTVSSLTGQHLGPIFAGWQLQPIIEGSDNSKN